MYMHTCLCVMFECVQLSNFIRCLQRSVEAAIWKKCARSYAHTCTRACVCVCVWQHTPVRKLHKAMWRFKEVTYNLLRALRKLCNLYAENGSEKGRFLCKSYDSCIYADLWTPHLRSEQMQKMHFPFSPPGWKRICRLNNLFLELREISRFTKIPTFYQPFLSGLPQVCGGSMQPPWRNVELKGIF